MKILVINPGSTSTKMAVYDYENPVFVRNIAHTAEDEDFVEAVASLHMANDKKVFLHGSCVRLQHEAGWDQNP